MRRNLRWTLALALGAFLTFSFQNCGSGFNPLTEQQRLALSCGTSVNCDSTGHPLGRIVIDQLSPEDYPSGSYSQARVETKTQFVSGGLISFLRLKNLPSNFSCTQTWLKGSFAHQNGTNTYDLLASLDQTPCRLGNVAQESELLDYMLRSGCFFVETNYTVQHDLTTGALNLNITGTAVLDDDMSRTRVPTARIRFRCELIQ